MLRPLLSIITVTHNDLEGAHRTLKSLEPILSGAGPKVSIHVVDGGTTGFLDSDLRKYMASVDIVSEKDAGIYDAMNKGLNRAAGRYVWFLNGGDESLIRDWSVLERSLENANDRLIFCSYEMNLFGKSKTRRPRRHRYIKHGLPTSHQAIFYPTRFMTNPAYDCSYVVAGDYHLTASLIAAGVQSTNSDLVVAHFGDAGWSATNARRLIEEAGRVQRDVLGVNRFGLLKSMAHHQISCRVRALISNA